MVVARLPISGITDELGGSTSTAKSCINCIYGKLGVKSRVSVCVKAERNVVVSITLNTWGQLQNRSSAPEYGQNHSKTRCEPADRADFRRLVSGESVQSPVDHYNFRQTVRKNGAEPVIPSRSNRKEPYSYDKHLYKERHLVECFIGKIKHYRRIFSRFEKLAKRYLGFLSFVSALIWLR